MFGLAHCAVFSCLMNESKSSLEALKQPMILCPLCMKKIYKMCRMYPEKKERFRVSSIVKLCNTTAANLVVIAKIQEKAYLLVFIYLFNCIFILLLRESDQCATRARLGVASHLSITPKWENPAKCLSQRHK